MARTQQDLIAAVLGKLNVLGVGETPTPEDALVVQQYIAPRVAQLSAEQVTFIPDIETIEDDVFIPLSILIANAAAPEFGQPRQDEVDAAQERILRGMAPVVSRPPARVDYF